MAACGGRSLLALAFALVRSACPAGVSSACWRSRGLAAAARLGRADAVRPVAGRADRGRTRGARLGTAAARDTGCSAPGSARRSGPACSCRLRSRTCGVRAAGGRRSSASASRPAVVAAVVLPFVVLAPHGVWTSFERQLSRPLQIESLGAALDRHLASRPRHGRDDGLEPRLAKHRRHDSAYVVGWIQTRRCSSSVLVASGSCSRVAGGRARSSCSSPPRPSWRSWRWARCCRRSS